MRNVINLSGQNKGKTGLNIPKRQNACAEFYFLYCTLHDPRSILLSILACTNKGHVMMMMMMMMMMKNVTVKSDIVNILLSRNTHVPPFCFKINLQKTRSIT